MKYFSTSTAAIAVFIFAGCGSTPPANQPQASNTVNQSNQPAAETKPATPAVSPTETLKALNTAAKVRDVATIKKYLSSGTLALFEETANQEEKPVDDLLRTDPPLTLLAETGKEQISGDTATVEVKETAEGPLDKIPFVVENGEWKVALDIYLEELERRLADTSNSNTANAPKP